MDDAATNLEVSKAILPARGYQLTKFVGRQQPATLGDVDLWWWPRIQAALVRNPYRGRKEAHEQHRGGNGRFHHHHIPPRA
jgi:hypothetical protein